jgi:hypothetical protein
MSSTGPQYPGTLTEGTGVYAWTNLDNARLSDDARAVATITIVDLTKQLIYSNFGFAIPAGAVVTGVSCRLEGQDLNGGSICTLCRIHQNGTLIGNNVASPDFLTTAGGPDQNNLADGGANLATYGAAVQALTPADWNASTLGVMIQFNAAGAETISIDACTLEVTYDPPGGIHHTKQVLTAMRMMR